MNNQNPWVLIHQDNYGTITSAMEIEGVGVVLRIEVWGDGVTNDALVLIRGTHLETREDDQTSIVVDPPIFSPFDAYTDSRGPQGPQSHPQNPPFPPEVVDLLKLFGKKLKRDYERLGMTLKEVEDAANPQIRAAYERAADKIGVIIAETEQEISDENAEPEV